MSSAGSDAEVPQEQILDDVDIVTATIDGRVRTCARGNNSCKICYENIDIQTPEYLAQCYIDGRLACDKCRVALTTSFTSQYYVCINLLCRRKWKQLTPRVVPFFCPSCRKSLETKLRPQGSQSSADIAYLQQLFDYWVSVIECLSKSLPFEWSLLKSREFEPSDSLQTTLDAFYEGFNNIDVPVESCRNWNSMLVRKKYYVGEITQKDPKTNLCRLVPTLELTENFKPMPKNLNAKNFNFFMLDWKDEYVEGQKMYFIAFPNPVLDKHKDYVRHIIKVIPGPENSNPEKVVEGALTQEVKKELLPKESKNNNKGKFTEQPSYNQNNFPNIDYSDYPGMNTGINFYDHGRVKKGSGKGGKNDYHSNEAISQYMRMEPAKISSPFASPLLASMREQPSKVQSPFASPLIASSINGYDRTPSYFTPNMPLKVTPLWKNNEDPLNIILTDASKTGSESSQSRGACLPSRQDPLKNLEEDENLLGDLDGFGDLMHWTTDGGKNDGEKKWYDPIEEGNIGSNQFSGVRHFQRQDSRNIQPIPTVPEDQPISHQLDWPMRTDGQIIQNDSKKSFVPPQSPWAVYFGD